MDGSVEARAYRERMLYRCSWRRVAEATGFSDHSGARKAAHRYALENGLPWPLRPASLGSIIYRKAGLSWMYLSRHYCRPIRDLQVLTYKWARRNARDWPPGRHL